jgi:uncharacterized membrane protein YsdA (DUF1294 family)
MKQQRSKQRERQRRANRGASTLLSIPAFSILYVATWATWALPLWVGGLYLLLSAMTFVAYAADKSAAASGAWRTPERTLHGLALAGGWPGALLAQHVLRHKSTKPIFRQVFWITVAVNVLGFVALAAMLRERPPS